MNPDAVHHRAVWSAVALALVAPLTACEPTRRQPPSPATTVADSAAGGAVATPATPVATAAPVLVDTAQAPAVAGEEGWMYSQSVETDLDGDGVAERAVIAARAEVMNGRPLWDDGQPWQVYVQEPDGARTYLYARYVQLGTLTMRVGLAEGENGATVLLLEHLPDRLALYEVAYRGTGRVDLVRSFERTLDPTGELASPALP